MDQSKIIVANGESEVVVKKSRFLGVAAYVDSEQAAKNIVNAIKKEHYTARHVCYAYLIGEDNPKLKYSDDGEPGGTAGKPILDVITNSGIHNIIVAVTRYFGGILLGTGGLVRAYTDAAKAAVENAEIKEVCMNRLYDILVDYGELDRVKFLLDAVNGVSMDMDYTDKVNIHLTIPEIEAEATMKKITELTSARALITYKSSFMG
ncbi:MAG: YigZ family protein [Eubacterium sp.]|nr:YigZ family protein [Eubacterium sp.]